MGNNDFENEVDENDVNKLEKNLKIIVSGDTPGDNYVSVEMTTCLVDCIADEAE